jgi:hypothetical protein
MKEQSRPSIPSFLYSIVPLVGLFWISSFGFRILVAERQAAAADLKPAAAERKGYAVLRSYKRGPRAEATASQRATERAGAKLRLQPKQLNNSTALPWLSLG